MKILNTVINKSAINRYLVLSIEFVVFLNYIKYIFFRFDSPAARPVYPVLILGIRLVPLALATLLYVVVPLLSAPPLFIRVKTASSPNKFIGKFCLSSSCKNANSFDGSNGKSSGGGSGGGCAGDDGYGEFVYKPHS
uniref:Uncharacterized protein n=1 Tax=Glossina brevipalpis TaxID=37001 RepID=A0A1A9X078_9MUSC